MVTKKCMHFWHISTLDITNLHTVSKVTFSCPIKKMNLEDKITTMDALLTQTEIAKIIFLSPLTQNYGTTATDHVPMTFNLSVA